MHTLLHSVPQPCSRSLTTHASTRDSWTLTGQVWLSLLWGHCSFLLGPHASFCLCPPRVCFPVLCKFWWLCGGANGDLLQEGLCHTQVSCNQSPCPCSSPLLTQTSAGDTQTQFWLNLCGVSGSWCAQSLFEPSKRHWHVWSLILNVISSLLPSCWGFSFALGRGVPFFWWDPTFSYQWLFSSEM